MTHCEMLKTNHKFLYNFFLVYLDKAVIRKKKQLGGGGGLVNNLVARGTGKFSDGAYFGTPPPLPQTTIFIHP